MTFILWPKVSPPRPPPLAKSNSFVEGVELLSEEVSDKEVTMEEAFLLTIVRIISWTKHFPLTELRSFRQNNSKNIVIMALSGQYLATGLLVCVMVSFPATGSASTLNYAGK